jgi:uncharacterized protein YnzC (UPF0291/DUF896 family)
MILRTFNLDEDVYKKFSDFCRDNGISMSKQINIFIEAQIEENPKVRQEYLEKLERIRKGKFIKIGIIDNIKKRYQ